MSSLAIDTPLFPAPRSPGILLLYKVSPCSVGCSGVSMTDFLPFSQKLPVTPALHCLLQRALSNDSSNSAHSSTPPKNIPCILTPSTHNRLEMTPGKALVLCVHQHELNLPSGDVGISRTWCICPSLMSVFVLIQALELAVYCFPEDLSRHWVPASRLWSTKKHHRVRMFHTPEPALSLSISAGRDMKNTFGFVLYSNCKQSQNYF